MKIKNKFDPVEFLVDHIPTLVFIVLALGLYVHTMGHSMMAFGGFGYDLLNRVGAYLPMALGAGLILMVSGADLSAGRVMGFSALIAAALLQNADAMSKVFPDMQPMSVSVVFIIAIMLGMAISAINGVIVSTLKAPSFAVTLGTQTVLRGCMLIFLGKGTNAGQNIYDLVHKYTEAIIGNGAIPKYVTIAIGLALALWVVITFTPVGRMMREIGADKESEKKLGAKALVITLIAFAAAGALYGYNGFVEAARIGGPGATAGVNAELDALIACLIGGMSLKGGKGGIGGIVIGVIILQLVSLCLQWMAISANIVYIVKGGMIVLAVILDMLRWKIKRVEK